NSPMACATSRPRRWFEELGHKQWRLNLWTWISMSATACASYCWIWADYRRLRRSQTVRGAEDAWQFRRIRFADSNCFCGWILPSHLYSFQVHPSAWSGMPPVLSVLDRGDTWDCCTIAANTR